MDSFNFHFVHQSLISGGFLHCRHANGLLVWDIVPVDLVVNQIIAVAHHIGCGSAPSKEKDGDLMRIFNCTSGSINPISFGDMEQLAYR